LERDIGTPGFESFASILHNTCTAMSPREKAQAAFISALILLLFGGVAAYISINQLLKTQEWVSRSRDAQAAIGEVEFASVRFGRARMGYVNTGKPEFLSEFNASLEEVNPRLEKLRELVEADPDSIQLWNKLDALTEQRIDLARKAVELKQAHPGDDRSQDQLNLQSVPLLSQTTGVTEKLRAQQGILLTIHQRDLRRRLAVTLSILALTLLAAVAMLIVHYRLLSGELAAREQAEQASRGLSRRLMDIQDEERRKFSRELHDGLGQQLAATKMSMERVARDHPDDPRASDSVRLLEQALSETRTISYLLHPPLLEVAGFSAAAKWFVDGFAQRSGIHIETDVADCDARMLKPIESVLFRVLQESLTNIHRYAKCTRAKVIFAVNKNDAMLTVKDEGVGIPQALLDRFQEHTTSGVGLAGMRERVQELGGRFELQSGPGAGTTVQVVVSLNSRLKV
jgi:signal transduction histidine kinase